MKELLEKINLSIGSWWWVILAVLILVIVVFIIIIKAKNSRIRKLKKQLKLTRTELEVLHTYVELKADETTENSNGLPLNQSHTNTQAQQSAAQTIAEQTQIKNTQTLMLDEVETIVLDEQPEQATEIVATKPTELPEPTYYTKATAIATSSGTVKFTVVYDRIKDSWVIKKDGVDRVVRRVDTKEEAMLLARELCKKYNARLVVHKKDGKFQKVRK